MKPTLHAVLAASAALFLATAAHAQVPAAPSFSPAETAAIYTAAKFTRTGEKFHRCGGVNAETWLEDAGDLNGDGRNEVWAKEYSDSCYINGGISIALVTKGADGAWTHLLDAEGEGRIQTAKTKGWPDIGVGAPGLTRMTMYKFNGQKYEKTPAP